MPVDIKDENVLYELSSEDVNGSIWIASELCSSMKDWFKHNESYSYAADDKLFWKRFALTIWL